MDEVAVPTPQQERERGNEAAQLLESRAFQEASAQIRAGIINRMKTAAMLDEKLHTRLILLLQCWESIEAYLQQSKQTGEFAVFKIDEERKRRTLVDVVRDLRA